MVVVPEYLMGGQSPIKRSDREIFCKEQTLESVKNALQFHGVDNAVIRFDRHGNIRMQRLPNEVPEPTSAASVEIDEDEDSDYGDEEFPSYQPPSSRLRGNRILRAPRQRVERGVERGRCMLPRDASRQTATEQYPPLAPVQEPVPVKLETQLLRPKKMAKSLRIDDRDNVQFFLLGRLKRMQQLADKKIAKAWIKGICPKKQAKFPYQNKKGEEQDGVKPKVPGWWPHPKEVCRFIEPDHIKRDERMKLCLHLLRLRPSPAQLAAWNQDKSEPHPTHVLRGWTAFLKELAGNEIFDELPREDKKRTEQRRELMRQMYDVAELEERYLGGELDGDYLFQWEEDEEERKVLPTKRSRQLSFGSNAEPASRESSASVSCTRAKKSRRLSNLDVNAAMPQQCHDVDLKPSQQPMLLSNAPFGFPGMKEGPMSFSQSDDTSQPRNSDPFVGQYDMVTMKRDSSMQGPHADQANRWRSFQPAQPQWVDHSAATQSYQQPAPPSSFPGKHEYTFPQYHHQTNMNMVQVHQAANIPEPQFQTVPSTPMYSPSDMAPMPLSTIMPQDCGPCLPQQQTYPSTMAGDQYYLPANAHQSSNEFHPSMGHVQHQPQPPFSEPQSHRLAERHIAPMQFNGLPFTQPSGWDNRNFQGQCQNPS